MKFYSPLTADFFPNEPDYEDEFYDEYEGCPLDGHDLLQYADAVDEAVKKDIADFNGNLMQYYREDDSVRRKVVRAVPNVDEVNGELVGSLWVDTDAPLTAEEQAVFCAYISGQYSDGWGEGFEQREISVDDGGELYVHFWNSDEWSIQTEQELFSPKLAEGLPELCFSTLPGTGELICIKRGEIGYYHSDWNTDDPTHNRELADYNNERLGVTPAQEKAMKTGSMFGWDVPGANPKVYEQNGMKMGGMTLG